MKVLSTDAIRDLHGVDRHFSLPPGAQRIENALEALAAVMADTSQPMDVRKRAASAHRLMHGCRDAVTVRRMEAEKGMR